MSESTPPSEQALAPAFYARPRFVSRPAVRDWWTLLHPPYTMWHLSYVVIGSCIAAPVDAGRLGFTVFAFFLAVGIGAHALDELQSRPLATAISNRTLIAASIVGLGGAAAVGVLGITRVGVALVAFIAVGVVLAVAYNLELVGGRLHTDMVFAASWGSFPVLTGYFAQHERVDLTSLTAAAFAFWLSSAQRRLSTPARTLRRKTAAVHGTIVGTDGTTIEVSQSTLLRPLEGALRTLSWATASLAAALVLARLGPWP